MISFNMASSISIDYTVIGLLEIFIFRIRVDLGLISIFWVTVGCPRGEMVKATDCGIILSEFVFQSHYYVHFRANTLGKGMNPIILPVMR